MLRRHVLWNQETNNKFFGKLGVRVQNRGHSLNPIKIEEEVIPKLMGIHITNNLFDSHNSPLKRDKNMHRLQVSTMAAVMSLTTASPVFSDDDTGFYLGASANWLSADQRDVNDVSFEDSDTAFGLKAGYMFTDLFGIEGGYMDLGDYNARGNNQNLNLDADGFYLVGVLNFSVAESWDLYGKLGGFFFDSDTNLTGFDKSSTELFGTLGAEYDFGNWNIFGEFSKLDTDTNDLSIDILSVGVKYEFSR